MALPHDDEFWVFVHARMPKLDRDQDAWGGGLPEWTRTTRVECPDHEFQLAIDGDGWDEDWTDVGVCYEQNVRLDQCLYAGRNPQEQAEVPGAVGLRWPSPTVDSRDLVSASALRLWIDYPTRSVLVMNLSGRHPVWVVSGRDETRLPAAVDGTRPAVAAITHTEATLEVRHGALVSRVWVELRGQGFSAHAPLSRDLWLPRLPAEARTPPMMGAARPGHTNTFDASHRGELSEASVTRKISELNQQILELVAERRALVESRHSGALPESEELLVKEQVTSLGLAIKEKRGQVSAWQDARNIALRVALWTQRAEQLHEFLQAEDVQHNIGALVASARLLELGDTEDFAGSIQEWVPGLRDMMERWSDHVPDLLHLVVQAGLGQLRVVRNGHDIFFVDATSARFNKAGRGYTQKLERLLMPDPATPEIDDPVEDPPRRRGGRGKAHPLLAIIEDTLLPVTDYGAELRRVTAREGK